MLTISARHKYCGVGNQPSGGDGDSKSGHDCNVQQNAAVLEVELSSAELAMWIRHIRHQKEKLRWIWCDVERAGCIAPGTQH